MSTPNFTRKNFRDVYVVPNSDEEYFDSYDVQDFMIELELSLRHHLPKFADVQFMGVDNSISISFNQFITKGHEVSIGLELECLSGYYSGANIEYTIGIDGYEVDMQCIYEEYPKKFSTIKNRIDRLHKHIQKSLKKYCNTLEVVAIFSNGEAIYKSKEEN